MPDWRRFVRDRLGPLGLSRQREEEIHAELADHLQDESEKTSKPPGIDWNLLARDIRRAEEEAMSHTAKTIWMPGMAALLGATLVLFVMTSVVPPTAWVNPNSATLRLAEMLAPGEKAEPAWADARPAVVLLFIWMASYMAFGALGAFWSRRAGGGLADRFLAGVFPVALHLVTFLLPMFVTVFSSSPRFPEHSDPAWLIRTALVWVVIPGVLLAIGALPFLRNPQRKLA
jgi:hypothetical protein